MFTEKQAEDQLLGPIRQLFLDRGLHETYGVSLLHKHFSIQPTERLVDYHHVASPWEVGSQDTAVVPKYEGFVAPRSFRFVNGEAAPYEFSFSPTPPPMDGHEEFFKEVACLLDRLTLVDVFGIRLLSDHDPGLPMEVTEGTANLMMPVGSVPDSALTEALWVFSPDANQRCHCREMCRRDHGRHFHHHGCS
jgi:hypothetical protein